MSQYHAQYVTRAAQQVNYLATELLSQSDKQLTSHLMDNFVNIVIDSKINSYQVNHSNAMSCQSDRQCCYWVGQQTDELLRWLKTVSIW